MVKRLLLINIFISFLLCFFISQSKFFTKFPTRAALEGLEKDFIKKDLTEEEIKKLDYNKIFYIERIIGNEKMMRRELSNAKSAGIFLSILFMVNNIVLLILKELKKL